MNYDEGMKPQRVISPSKPMRSLRQSLRRNTTRGDAGLEAADARYGYVLIGARKLPVHKPDSRRALASGDAGATISARVCVNAVSTVPNYEVIEELFREARDGKFDSFSRRLKEIIQHYSAVDGTHHDASTASADRGVSPDPLAAARQRGVDYALTEWQKPENLTLQAAASYAGVSDNTINTRRQKQQIYALVAPNRSRGFRYPQWQFDVDPARLGAALKAFSKFGQDNCWVLHNLMTQPTPGLDGVRPCDFIADSSLDMQRLVQFINTCFSNDDQGVAWHQSNAVSHHHPILPAVSSQSGNLTKVVDTPFVPQEAERRDK
ncbi:hypothetical protein RY831_03275 [Noviherbaspirillum sp. CPCC 100848]|uniref:DUF2384 domain-containing protein n=1 Tax=Noviherbaspirillum album TaxID=3080276 RepID=A0ABU6J4L3_9BURK|nr:hypothetical protein [Noviherbaspirillum sp. CPCC 100848]MEC4718154.1 hypothetical protein [Noviherbaspirillum sp. CPCC 100848]